MTRSQCLYPVNANVSSPNCQVIETVSLPNRGPYSYLGILGIWIVIVGLIGVAMVTIFSIFLYLAYGLEARSTRS